jgi:hypothetical protein
VLREHHKRARQVDVCLKETADYFRENLADSTRYLLSAVPQQMDAWEREAIEKYGYDLERREWVSDAKQFISSARVAKGFVGLLNTYYTYWLVIEQWKFFVQSGMRGEPLQAAVCHSLIEAYRQRPGIAAKGIEALEAGMPGFPPGLALSVYLTTHVATHTSLRINGRLRARMKELRADDESGFSRLLKELPAEVLAAYRERDFGWGNLMDVRTEAARSLEKAGAKTEMRPQTQELATFAEREALLKKARLAGLTAREHELFKFFLENRRASNADAARALGVAEGTIRSLKSRIKKAIYAA